MGSLGGGRLSLNAWAVDRKCSFILVSFSLHLSGAALCGHSLLGPGHIDLRAITEFSKQLQNITNSFTARAYVLFLKLSCMLHLHEQMLAPLLLVQRKQAEIIEDAISTQFNKLPKGCAFPFC